MTGDKAKDAYSPISPYIDLKSVFSDEQQMEQNLKFRNSRINFSETMEKYSKFNKMFGKKQSLEKHRDEISSELKSLQKSKATGKFTFEKIGYSFSNIQNYFQKMKSIP